MDAFIIILTGSLVAVSCSLLGNYLILRKMAMVSDAISHAVLPGIVVAFMISGGADSFGMLIGAGLVGVLTTFLIEFFHRSGKLQTDASIGVTFTWLFAIGVILISYYAGDAHIDQDCVLYGEIAYVPLDLIALPCGSFLGPRALIVMSVVLILILLFIGLNYKELYITTFDPEFAQATGFKTQVWHYLLMSMVSLTTVASFESVGAILVVALLIAPPATAYLISSQLHHMLWLSAALGITASISGYYLAFAIDGSIAGAIATVTGIQFGLVFVIQQLLTSRKKRKAYHEMARAASSG
jgi:manganese/zinc/iron transport system permease protein